MTQLFVNRKVKAEIRKWVAAEIRGRIAEGPPEDAPDNVVRVWRQYCCEIAQQVSREGR